MKKSTLLFVTILISFFPFGDLFAKGKVKVDKALEHAARQYLYMRSELQGSNQFPKTYDKHMQRLKTSNSEWWCSGFYPGTLFYLYEDTGDKELYAEGVRMLKLLEPEQYNVNTHDVGFMMYCSYGNANRIAPKPEYKDIMVNSARSLISRFSPVVGCIKSHNRKPDDYVVIIVLEDVPEKWIAAMDKYSYANQQFNPTLFAIEEHIDLDKVDSLSARLAAMGLLGFDLDDNSFFYRRLPFKTERILSLNPRMIAAEKLLEEEKVEIISNDGNRIEARVAGSGGVRHTVILDREGEKERCTCTWFSGNQGERGACKHILAVKKLVQWKN